MVKYNVVTTRLYSVSVMRQGSVKIILKLRRNIFKILFIQSIYLHVQVQFVGIKLIYMFNLHGGCTILKVKYYICV